MGGGAGLSLHGGSGGTGRGRPLSSIATMVKIASVTFSRMWVPKRCAQASMCTPSPLAGEGWGGGSSSFVPAQRLLSPHRRGPLPDPPPQAGEGEEQPPAAFEREKKLAPSPAKRVRGEGRKHHFTWSP